MPASRLILLYRRLTGSVPLLVSVILHGVLIAGAAVYVVSETIVARKKTFEAPPAADPGPARRQIEHRLQVARKSGAASPSPVMAQRILSTAAGALALPPMPELAAPGVGSLGGFGGFGQGAGLGNATDGIGTSLGSTSLGGNGFMSLSFLGLTNLKAQRVVFVVDIGRSLMDIRKGGFQAFGVIREEIMRLVGQLPPAAEFGVVLYDGQNLSATGERLQPATVRNKTTFFEWLQPVNAKLDALGLASAGGATEWVRQPVSAGDEDYNPSPWVNALHAAMQMKPDTVFVITGAAGYGSKRMAGEEIDARQRSRDRELDTLRQQGLDLEAVTRARRAALAKARAELNALNRWLVGQGRDPLVVTESRRIMDADFQSALAGVGGSIVVDTTGWRDATGQPIWVDSNAGTSEVRPASLSDVQSYVAALQSTFVRERAALNFFLFTGPEDRPQTAMDGFTQIARRHGGRFELLTARRLEEIASRRP